MGDSSNNFSKLPDGEYVINFESGWSGTDYKIIISEDGKKMFFLSYRYSYEYQSDELYRDGSYTIKIVSYDSNTKIYQVVDERDNKGTISEPEPEPEPGKEVKITNDNFKEACKLWTSNRNKAISIYGNISNWDTSTVTDMSYAFYNGIYYKASNFNDDISKWDVSSVTNMKTMFRNCNLFNQDISNWNVSKVTNMEGMFHLAKKFNQKLNNWDVSNVTNMSFMFYNKVEFNQKLNNWDVSKVTNMVCMFHSCINFNQPLSDWNVSNVTNMGSMFFNCPKFNQPLTDWDVSKVTNMQSMFSDCDNFNQNLSNWNMSPSIYIMDEMFRLSIKMILNGYPANPLADKWKNYYNPIKPLKLPDGKYRINWNFSIFMRWRPSGAYNIKVENDTIFLKHYYNYEFKLNQEFNYYNNSSIGLSQYIVIKYYNEDTKTYIINCTESTSGGILYRTHEIDDSNIRDLVDKWIKNPEDPQFTDITHIKYVGHISEWDVSDVTDMSGLFKNNTNFNEFLKNWDLSNVKNTKLMFQNTKLMLEKGYPETPDINSWDKYYSIKLKDGKYQFKFQDRAQDYKEVFIGTVSNNGKLLTTNNNIYEFNGIDYVSSNSENISISNYNVTTNTYIVRAYNHNEFGLAKVLSEYSNNIKLSDGIYTFDHRQVYFNLDHVNELFYENNDYYNFGANITQLIVSNNGNKIYDTINGIIYIFSNGYYKNVASSVYIYYDLSFSVNKYNEDTKEYEVHDSLYEQIGRLIEYEESSDNLKNGYYNITWETGKDKGSYNIHVSNDKVNFYEGESGEYIYMNGNYIAVYDNAYYFSIVDYDKSSGIYTLLDQSNNKGTAILDESKMNTDYIKIKNGIYKYNNENYEDDDNGNLVVTNFGNNISIINNGYDSYYTEFYTFDSEYFISNYTFDVMNVESYDEAINMYTINEMGATSTVTLQPSELNPDEIKFKDGFYSFEWEKGYNGKFGNSFNGLIEDNGNVFYGEDLMGTHYYHDGKYKSIRNLEINFSIVSYDESTGVYNLVDDRNLKGTAKVIELFVGKQITDNKLAVNKMNQDDNNITAMTNDDTSVTNISSDDNNMLVIKNNDNSKMIPLTLNPNTYRLMKLMMKNKK